jgi:hypothetical protein
MSSSSRKQIVGVDVFSRYGLVPHGDARHVNGLRVPGYERVPPRKGPSFGKADVGTGPRQPVHVPDTLRRKPDTVRAGTPAVSVYGASAIEDIQEWTGNRREMHLTGLFIPQFLKTADAATVTDGVPLFGTHLVQ